MRAVANVLGAAIERQQVDEQVRERRTLLSNVLNSAADAIVSFDEEWRVMIFNVEAQRIFGYEADEILGRSLDLLLPINPSTAPRELSRAEGDATEPALAMGVLNCVCVDVVRTTARFRYRSGFRKRW